MFLAILTRMARFAPQLSTKSHIMGLWPLVLIVAGALILVPVWSSWTVKEARQSAVSELQFAAERGAAQIGHALRALELVMRTTAAHVAATGTKEGLQPYLKQLTARLPPVRTVTVISPDGVIRTDLRPGEPAKGYKVPDRAYFRAHFPPNAVNDYFYSPPIKSRLDGLTQITLSVAARRANGDLAAVVVSSIDDRFFSGLSQELKAVGRYDARILYQDGRDVYTLHEPAPAGDEHGVLVDFLARVLGGSKEFHRKKIAVAYTDLSFQLSLPAVSYLAEAAPRVVRGSLTIGLIVSLLSMVWWLAHRGREQIMASERRFRDFAETTSDWFWEMDADLRFSYFSDHFPEITGVTQDTLLGKTREETGIPDVDPDVWANHLADLEAHRGFVNFVHPRINRNGKIIWLSINGKPVFDADGVFQGYRGTGTDITERVQAEQALENSEARLRRSVLDAPIPIMIHAEGGEVLMISNRWTELSGYSHSDIPNILDWTEKAYGVDKDHMRERIGSLYEIEEPYEDEAFVTTASGEQRIWDFRTAPLGRLPDGRRFVISMGLDITDRMQAEAAIKASQDRLAGILDIAPEAVIAIGIDRKIQLFNTGAERIFGYKADEMLGRPLEALMPEQFRDTHRKQVEGFDDSGDTFRLMDRRQEIVGLRKDGTEFPASASVSKLEIAGEKIFTVMMQDITERKLTQDAMVAAKTEAESANCAKSEFLAAMSHDLRTPLNAILGFADIISHQYFGPIEEKYQEYADDIQASGEHLLTLVNEILDLSTIEAGKQSLVKEELSTIEVVAECKKFIEGKTRSKNIDLVTKIAKNIAPLYADRRATKQILLNLLSNAVKFTPKGGKITVSAKASKNNTTLKIADTGEGIPPEKLPKLTDPFTRADADPYLAEQGWGLGLTITKSLVDLHDGTLDIESTLGKGTTVTVTLPHSA